MPRYYIMDLDKGMAETVARGDAVSRGDRREQVAARRRAARLQRGVRQDRIPGRAPGVPRRIGSRVRVRAQLFAGRTIDQPSMFIGGKSDWGVYQNPGALERMQKTACTRMLGVHLVDGAGHWVQQEQPEATTQLILRFLQDTKLGIWNLEFGIRDRLWKPSYGPTALVRIPNS